MFICGFYKKIVFGLGGIIMSIFLEKCKVLNHVSNTLYEEVDKLAEKLIQLDLEDMLGQDINSGFNSISGDRPFEEINLDGTVFNLVNKRKLRYKAYVLHFKREFALPYLGFKYKGEIISPHIEGQPEMLLSQYNKFELDEITIQIEKRITQIRQDLSYIAGIQSYREVKFYYRNYGGLFDGEQVFKDLKEVINDYQSLL